MNNSYIKLSEEFIKDHPVIKCLSGQNLLIHISKKSQFNNSSLIIQLGKTQHEFPTINDDFKVPLNCKIPVYFHGLFELSLKTKDSFLSTYIYAYNVLQYDSTTSKSTLALSQINSFIAFSSVVPEIYNTALIKCKFPSDMNCCPQIQQIKQNQLIALEYPFSREILVSVDRSRFLEASLIIDNIIMSYSKAYNGKTLQSIPDNFKRHLREKINDCKHVFQLKLEYLPEIFPRHDIDYFDEDYQVRRMNLYESLQYRQGFDINVISKYVKSKFDPLLSEVVSELNSEVDAFVNQLIEDIFNNVTKQFVPHTISNNDPIVPSYFINDILLNDDHHTKLSTSSGAFIDRSMVPIPQSPRINKDSSILKEDISILCVPAGNQYCQIYFQNIQEIKPDLWIIPVDRINNYNEYQTKLYDQYTGLNMAGNNQMNYVATTVMHTGPVFHDSSNTEIDYYLNLHNVMGMEKMDQIDVHIIESAVVVKRWNNEKGYVMISNFEEKSSDKYFQFIVDGFEVKKLEHSLSYRNYGSVKYSGSKIEIQRFLDHSVYVFLIEPNFKPLNPSFDELNVLELGELKRLLLHIDKEMLTNFVSFSESCKQQSLKALFNRIDTEIRRMPGNLQKEATKSVIRKLVKKIKQMMVNKFSSSIRLGPEYIQRIALHNFVHSPFKIEPNDVEAIIGLFIIPGLFDIAKNAIISCAMAITRQIQKLKLFYVLITYMRFTGQNAFEWVVGEKKMDEYIMDSLNSEYDWETGCPIKSDLKTKSLLANLIYSLHVYWTKGLFNYDGIVTSKGKISWEYWFALINCHINEIQEEKAYHTFACYCPYVFKIENVKKAVEQKDKDEFESENVEYLSNNFLQNNYLLRTYLLCNIPWTPKMRSFMTYCYHDFYTNSDPCKDVMKLGAFMETIYEYNKKIK